MRANSSKTAPLIKVCEQCNDPYQFRPNPNKPSRFCSKQCQLEHGRVTIICRRCNKPFTVQANLVDQRVYCSPKCRFRRRAIQCYVCYAPFTVALNVFQRAIRERSTLHCSKQCGVKGRALKPSKVTYIARICLTCENLFSMRQGRYGAEAAKYCSRACRNFKQDITCPICSTVFQVKRHQIKDSEAKSHLLYCSKPCADLGLTIKPRTAKRINKNCEICGTSYPVALYRKDSAQYCSRSCKSIAVIIKLGKERPTSIEVKTYEALNELGIEFEPQRRIGKFVTDAFIPAMNLIIECQGDYFHCNPLKYPDGPKDELQRRHVERDKRKHAFFTAEGFRLIELWETDINKTGAKELIARSL